MEDSDLWVFGVRNLHDDEDVAVGTIMAESVVWDDGDRIEDEPFGGTCCWSLDEYCGNVDAAIARAEKYTLSGRYALLGGKYCGNNDLIAEPHAVAIRDAVVLLVW